MRRSCALLILLFITACSTPHYYPVTEIAFAEASLAAARDVHAQRLASDKYQFATEELGRAKAAQRDGRMGAAKRHARSAQRWAEAAEERAMMRLARVPGKRAPASVEVAEEEEEEISSSGEAADEAPDFLLKEKPKRKPSQSSPKSNGTEKR